MGERAQEFECAEYMAVISGIKRKEGETDRDLIIRSCPFARLIMGRKGKEADNG